MNTQIGEQETAGLPNGYEVQIAGDVRIVAGGQVLIGGSPTRVARLTRRGSALLRDGRITVVDDASRMLADRLTEGNLASPVLHGPGAQEAELTVVVPVRDRTAQLDRLLSRLGPSLRCVVVDDGSLDPRSVAAVARRHGARLLCHTTNQGPAAARNTGLRSVSTPYIAFVDSDVEAEPEVLTRLCGHFADPRVVAVAPRVRGVTRAATARWFQRYDESSLSLDLGDRQALVRPGSAVSWLPSACLVVRRTSADIGFDETLRVAEDVDFVWRLVAAGGRVRYDAHFEVQHDSRTTLTAWLGRKMYYGTGGALLAERHGEHIAPAVMSPVLAVAALSLLAQRRWSAPVALACTLLTATRIRRSLPMDVGSTEEAGRLAVRGLSSVLSQCAQLILRHWWPATVCAVPFSARARRALLAAAVIDAALTPSSPTTGLVAQFVARRLDDLAYGAGLWIGSWRAKSLAALIPRTPSRRHIPAPPGREAVSSDP